jgi:VWFA-related protein
MPLLRQSLPLLIACALVAQEPKFSTDVNVVTLLATVRDKNGRIVKDLTREDFLLQEDGKPQTIAHFSRESDLPLKIGLLVDTSRSQQDVLEPERTASYRFLDQVLRENKDLAFVAHFDTRVEVLQPLTGSRQELSTALDRLRIPGRVATLLYEAVRKTAETQMRPQTGRKAFIVLSDGVSVHDVCSLATAIEFAQRADTIVYTILFAEHPKLYRPGRAAVRGIATQHGKGVMQRLAKETGGAYFEVTENNPLEKIYTRIDDELRNQYSIGFTPPPGGKSGQFHKIKVTAKRPGIIVQTREGYYAR